MELNKPIDLELTGRYFQQNRGFAIRDVFDALVELITNSDDSYHRLHKKKKRSEDGGPILIEVEHRKNQPSLIIVRDRAEGMTLRDMQKKIAIVGNKTSEEGDRGFMARGLKDCTALGDIVVESITDGQYYRSKVLANPPQFIPEADEKVNSKIRKELGIDKNGTSVTIYVTSDKRVPRIDTIISELPYMYALRDILSEKSLTKVKIKDGEKSYPIIYLQPEGELIVNEKFEVPEYPNAKCTLKIWKAQAALGDKSNDKFRKSGILIKGKRAIHECSLLHDGLEKDEISRKFFGRLECEYTDDLINEYDERENNGSPHPEDNPRFLIDPNRQQGLIREHPFTKALFRHPTEILRKLIEEEKQKTSMKKEEIANEATKKRLSELAKAASKFLSQQVDEIEELTKGGHVDKDAFAKNGITIFPKYFNVALGEERLLTLYVNPRMLNDRADIKVWSKDKNALNVLDMQPELRPHSKRDDKMIATFRVKGDRLTDTHVKLIAKCGHLDIEAYGKVVERRGEEHEFQNDFEFGSKKYTVKEGRKRTLRIYAKYPELVTKDTQVVVVSSDSESLAVKGQCLISPVAGSNFAIGEIKVHSRRVKNKAVKVTANLSDHEAICSVKTVSQDEQRIDFEIDLSDEPMIGSVRAEWAASEGQPNKLKIFVQHDSLKRYIGPAPNFIGQIEPHFRILLAEIAAESICRKALQYETQQNPWEFRFADSADDRTIADAVFVELQKRMRKFLPIAHRVMLSDEDILKISN